MQVYTGFWCHLGFIVWIKTKKNENMFYVTKWLKTMEEWEENFYLCDRLERYTNHKFGGWDLPLYSSFWGVMSGREHLAFWYMIFKRTGAECVCFELESPWSTGLSAALREWKEGTSGEHLQYKKLCVMDSSKNVMKWLANHRDWYNLIGVTFPLANLFGCSVTSLPAYTASFLLL